MSYLDQPQTSNRNLIALGVAVLLHVFLGYAFVTGLAQDVIKKVVEPLETVNIEEEVPPEEEPPPPPPEEVEVQVVTPPPDVVVNVPPPPQTLRTETTVITPTAPVSVAPAPAPAPTPVIEAPPPPPPRPVQRTAAEPRGSGNSISQDDYPSASLRAEEQGTVRVSYTVTTEGRAANCSVVQPSGFPRLDEATCRIVERRFRFKPATEDGKPVTETKTQPVRWQITDR